MFNIHKNTLIFLALVTHGLSNHLMENFSNTTGDLNNNVLYPAVDCLGQSNEPAVPLIASFDAGWQKRGTGHAYNSLTGHASLIGYHSGKVLAFATRSKKCAMCASGHDKDDHDCRMNFDRSAKAMEPDIAVELIAKNKMLNEENVTISVMIGDDDASSISAVRREAMHKVDKWSDINHVKKGLTSALYNMKLPKGTIDYFSRAFSCALKQNKGDETAVRAAITNIVDHAYGEHEKCGAWCRSQNDAGEYVHARLPKGKPLTDRELRADLTNIFLKYANNAKKLAPCGSSQANESFNNLVASKHSKNRFYGGSESLDYRVAAAVCQKNIGTVYAVPLFEKLSLSPGEKTAQYRAAKDKVREERASKAATTEQKKRRLFLAQTRSGKNAATQKKEGITYETECELSGVSQLLWKEPVASENIDWTESKIVLFDLETSGLGRRAEICQIAASTETQSFNTYMVPTSITPAAAAVTGLRVEVGELYLNDERVDTVPLRIGLSSFITFLRNIGGNIILVAHNGFRFDVPMILRNMRQVGLLSEFTDTVKGFADTLGIFRDQLEDRRKAKKRFSQSALAVDYLGDEATVGAHDAANDIDILRQLIKSIGVADQTIHGATKTASDILGDLDRAAVQATHKATLEILKPNVSIGMISKMAKAGISMTILQESFMNGGENAIKMLLGEDIGGRPRVTKCTKVVKGVVEQLEKINLSNNL